MIWYKIATVWRVESRIQRPKAALWLYQSWGCGVHGPSNDLPKEKKSHGFKTSYMKAHEEGH